MTTENIWIHDGATVAIEDTNRMIEFDTVARLTPTQIILAGGRRFNRAHLRELASDNGRGVKTNREGRLVDPTRKSVVDTYARQLFKEFVREAETITYGAGATIHQLGAAEIREELNRLSRLLSKTRLEIDRRTGL